MMKEQNITDLKMYHLIIRKLPIVIFFRKCSTAISATHFGFKHWLMKLLGSYEITSKLIIQNELLEVEG